MRRILLFLIPAITFAGCASVSGPPRTEENKRVFGRLLKERDIEGAARFAVYFASRPDSDPEQMAQYFLFRCQFRQAFPYVQKIANPKRRALFEGVMGGLLSVFVSPAVTRPGARRGKALPVPNGEIWRDEWEALRISGDCPSGVPLIRDERKRAAFKDWARSRFQQLSIADFPDDFNAVVLALLVAYPIDDPAAWMAKYRDAEASPQFSLLQSGKEIPLRTHLSANQNEAEVTLGVLNLSRDPERRGLEIPYLLTP